MLSEAFNSEPMRSERALALRRVYAEQRANILGRFAAFTQRPQCHRGITFREALAVIAKNELVVVVHGLRQPQ